MVLELARNTLHGGARFVDFHRPSLSDFVRMQSLETAARRTAMLACMFSVVGACATQRSAQQRVTVVHSVMQGSSGRDDFEAELKSTASARARSRSARDLSGNLRIHIGDDSIVQYWLIIENPNAEVFTGAQLRRVSRSGSQSPVAIFFSDASSRDRRLQFRGTMSLVRTNSIGRLIQDVRSSPDSFFVSVRGQGGREVMRGQLR